MSRISSRGLLGLLSYCLIVNLLINLAIFGVDVDINSPSLHPLASPAVLVVSSRGAIIDLLHNISPYLSETQDRKTSLTLD